MENQYQKVVSGSYLALAALVAFLSLTVLMKLSSIYDFESHVKSAELIIRIASVGIGGLVFFVLYSNSKANTFMNEVAVELLTKVTWPTGKETSQGTVVVMITVVLAGVVLALFDWIFTNALQGFWTFAQKLFS